MNNNQVNNNQEKKDVFQPAKTQWTVEPVQQPLKMKLKAIGSVAELYFQEEKKKEGMKAEEFKNPNEVLTVNRKEEPGDAGRRAEATATVTPLPTPLPKEAGTATVIKEEVPEMIPEMPVMTDWTRAHQEECNRRQQWRMQLQEVELVAKMAEAVNGALADDRLRPWTGPEHVKMIIRCVLHQTLDKHLVDGLVKATNQEQKTERFSLATKLVQTIRSKDLELMAHQARTNFVIETNHQNMTMLRQVMERMHTDLEYLHSMAGQIKARVELHREKWHKEKLKALEVLNNRQRIYDREWGGLPMMAKAVPDGYLAKMGALQVTLDTFHQPLGSPHPMVLRINNEVNRAERRKREEAETRSGKRIRID